MTLYYISRLRLSTKCSVNYSIADTALVFLVHFHFNGINLRLWSVAYNIYNNMAASRWLQQCNEFNAVILNLQRVSYNMCSANYGVTVIPLVYSYFKYSQCCVWRRRYEIHSHRGSIIVQFSTHFLLWYFVLRFLFSLSSFLHHFLFISLYLLFYFIFYSVLKSFGSQFRVLWSVCFHFLYSSFTVCWNSYSIVSNLKRRLTRTNPTLTEWIIGRIKCADVDRVA